MEKTVQNQVAASRKGMGDFTRLILAFYFCLFFLGLYQQYSLYSDGVLERVAGSNLIILMGHHLGFTAFLSLFLYFAFNALETLRPRMGLYMTAALLTAVLMLEAALTWFFVTRYEMPVVGLNAIEAIYTASGPQFLSVVKIMMASVLFFYGLYKWSAPMQLWMGRVYPFTLALFSLFLATLLARAEPISENKTKYLVSDWYKSALHFPDPSEEYISTDFGLDPLEEIYRKEEERIWRTTAGETAFQPLLNGQSVFSGNDTYFPDPFSKRAVPVYAYHKPGKKDLLRIQSTFYGRDFDRAYETAREFAHNGKHITALELCSYILSEIPDYADAEVLMGRILAWEGDYLKSAGILENAVRKHPFYEDAYAALLDTWYWGGDFDRSMAIQPFIEKYFKESATLNEKMHRAKKMKQNLLMSEESAQPAGLPLL